MLRAFHSFALLLAMLVLKVQGILSVVEAPRAAASVSEQVKIAPLRAPSDAVVEKSTASTEEESRPSSTELAMAPSSGALLGARGFVARTRVVERAIVRHIVSGRPRGPPTPQV